MIGLRTATKPVVDWVSRRVFGNTWNYRRNLTDMKLWAEARRAYQGSVDPIVHDFYRRFGYHPLPHGSVDPAVMQRIKVRFNTVIGDPAHASNPFADDPELYKTYNHGGLKGPAPEFFRHVRNTAKSIPEVFEVFGPGVVTQLRSALGSEFRVERVSATRSHHVPPEIRDKFEAGTDRWHFDDHGADRLRLFVLLSDVVTIADGPTSFFDRRYSRFLMLQGFDSSKRGDSEASGIPAHLLINNPHMIQHIGTIGSAMATQTSNCLHRAGTREPGTERDLLIFTVRAAKKLVIPNVTAPAASSTDDGMITVEGEA